MSRTRVVIDFGEGSGLGKEQQELLDVLAQQLNGEPLVLTSGKAGDKAVPVYNFLVTLRRVEEPLAVAV